VADDGTGAGRLAEADKQGLRGGGHHPNYGLLHKDIKLEQGQVGGVTGQVQERGAV